MKKTTHSLWGTLLFAVFTLAACGGEKKESFLSEETQKALADKPEVVEYLESIDEAVGAYVSMIEKVAQKSEEANKDGEVTSGEAFSALGSMVGGAMEMTEALEKIEKLEAEKGNMEENLGPEEKKAFVETYNHILQRMINIKKPE
jgi:hypothetical protein